MNLRLRDLAIATTAILGLSACNNSETLPTRHAKNADIDFMVKLPQTRGFIDDTAKEDKGKISHLVARVVSTDGKKVLGQAFAEGDDLKSGYKATINDVLVDGSERVEVVLNGIGGKYNVPIGEVQPNKDKPGLANAIHYGKVEGLGTIDETDGKYKVAVTAKPLVARAELAGKVKYNNRLVKSMDLVFVSPVDYTLVYGSAERQKKASDAELGLELKDVHKEGMEQGKVVANHLFAGDKTRITVGFNISKYAYLANSTTGAYITYTKDGKNYYIYQLTDDTYAVDLSLATDEKPEEGKEWTPKFKTVTYDEAKDKLTDGTEVPGGIEKIKVIPGKTEYFTLSNFAIKDGTRHDTYVGGNIYNINLTTGMRWNGTGSGHEDEYTPDTNTGTEGKDDNNDKDSAAVDVTVTITEFTYNETSVSVN